MLLPVATHNVSELLKTHHVMSIFPGLTSIVTNENPCLPDTIYDTSCTVKNTNVFATVAGVCDNAEFLCTPATKNIAEYDDPTSGLAYTCTADATVESCSSDKITYCVSDSILRPSFLLRRLAC